MSKNLLNDPKIIYKPPSNLVELIENDAPPSSLLDPKEGPTMLKCGNSWNLVLLPTSNTKGGERGMLKSSGIRLGRGTMYLATRSCIKTNHKLISPHSGSTLVLEQTMGNTDSFDSPRPRLGGSHHLPPYNIFCVCPRDLHPNGFLSRDSQGGVPKLSRFGFLGLWELITLSSEL